MIETRQERSERLARHKREQAEGRRNKAERRFLGPERYRQLQRAGWYGELFARSACEVLKVQLRKAMKDSVTQGGSA